MKSTLELVGTVFATLQIQATVGQKINPGGKPGRMQISLCSVGKATWLERVHLTGVQIMRTSEAFKLAYNGNRRTNFMTPNWISEGKRGKLHYELSEGRGMENQPIFGVTVVEETADGAQKRVDLSQMFQSIVTASQYITDL